MSKFEQYLEMITSKACSPKEFKKICDAGEQEIFDIYADGEKLTDKEITEAAKTLAKENNFTDDQKKDYIERMKNVRDNEEESKYI